MSMKEQELRRIIGRWLDENEGLAETMLRKYDNQFFRDKVSLSQAAKVFRTDGVEAPLRHISILIKDNKHVCSLWGKRIKPQARMHVVDEHYWDRLKSCVEKHLDLLQGVDIELAVRIVRVFMTTNRALMLGLPKRLHVWR